MFLLRDRRERGRKGDPYGTDIGAPEKTPDGFGKRARQKRIFARLREGRAYYEIAREERLTAARVRQIVSEVLQRRQVDDSMAHALLQLSRLGPAAQPAGEAVARGELQAPLAPPRGARPARPLPERRPTDRPFSVRPLRPGNL